MSKDQVRTEVDSALFAEIKAAQEDGITSIDIAKQHYLSLVVVNNIFSSKDWGDYSEKYSKKEKIVQNKQETVGPAQAGYYKGLIARKAEENSGLKEQRAWLLEQVYYLRKAVAFLEKRKAVLEDGVNSMEKQINSGISALEQLEENNNFTQISESTERKNR